MPSLPVQTVQHGGARHQGGTVGYIVAFFVHLHDARIGHVAQIKPDGGFGRHYIRLVPAVFDHVVGALDGVEVLEFRSEENFDIKFLAKTAPMWSKIVDKVSERRPGWAGEVPPSSKH